MRFWLILLTMLVSLAAHATPRVDHEAELRVLNRVNRERLAAGLRPVRPDPLLTSLARFHSADMALSQFVSPFSPGAGSLHERATAITNAGPACVAVHVGKGADPRAASAPVLTSSWIRSGIGIVEEDDRYYVTQIVACVAPLQRDALSLAARSFFASGETYYTAISDALSRAASSVVDAVLDRTGIPSGVETPRMVRLVPARDSSPRESGGRLPRGDSLSP
ncbi:MAG: CAP domain-containing protein [Deltaproteobacteria bacterium]|nr:CAP domain-containing protein [Deltaproteobacteria bacterium]